MKAQLDLGALAWVAGRLEVNGWVFEEEHADAREPRVGNTAFRLFKPTSLLRDYQTLLATFTSFAPTNLLELGLWDGGSLALFNELFQLEAAVGVDLRARGDSPYFREYVAAHPETRFETCWSTRQEDGQAVQCALRRAGIEQLDLIVDDASHLVSPTRQAFESLFPLLAPGGLYVIEDYGWAHLERFQRPDAVWQEEPSLVTFTTELVEALASGAPLGRIVFLPTLVAVERGREQIETPLRLDELVRRRPPHKPPSLPARTRRILGGCQRRLRRGLAAILQREQTRRP